MTIQQNNKKANNLIARYLKPFKYRVAIGLVFLLLSSATVMVFPFVIGKFVDAASGKIDWWLDDINLIALGLMCVLLLQSVFSFARVQIFVYVSEKAMAQMRMDLYNKLISLSVTFFEKNRTGALTSRITSDITQIQDVLSSRLAELFRQIATLMVGIGIVLITSTHLTLVMLSTFPVIIIVAFIFGKFIKKLSKETQDKSAAANTIVVETLQAINVVKAYTNELFESKKYSKEQNEVVRVALKAGKYRAAFISFVIFGLFGSIVLVIWYGARLIQAGEMSIGDLVSFLTYTVLIGGSAGGIGEMYSQVQKALGASERVAEILDEESEVEIYSIDKNKSILDGDINYESVSFAYPTRKDIQVLNAVSFTVKQGQKLAIVGPSGSGKTTIVQLLMRFYPIESGAIEIGGADIQSINISTLRNNISIVPQEVMLFGGSIKENIAYGKTDATNEEILAAAEKANALEFINDFPEKMDTIVGERGIQLSGGQRQRISIARAILKNPTVLILDEATSALDAESEKLVQEALEEVMKNRTTIIIAHRLSTIKNVDNIIVLNKGDIVEEGTHDELSKKKDGLYSHLSKLQFEA